MFLTTEEEEYAVFATTEFKEIFVKTHRFITNVSLFRFTYLTIFLDESLAIIQTY